MKSKNIWTDLTSIILLVFMCQDSTADNQWGPNPKK